MLILRIVRNFCDVTYRVISVVEVLQFVRVRAGVGAIGAGGEKPGEAKGIFIVGISCLSVVAIINIRALAFGIVVDVGDVLCKGGFMGELHVHGFEQGGFVVARFVLRAIGLGDEGGSVEGIVGSVSMRVPARAVLSKVPWWLMPTTLVQSMLVL